MSKLKVDLFFVLFEIVGCYLVNVKKIRVTRAEVPTVLIKKLWPLQKKIADSVGTTVTVGTIH
jgi:hypothetical protein